MATDSGLRHASAGKSPMEQMEKRTYVFIGQTGRFWPIAACHDRQLPAKSGLSRRAGFS